MNHILDYWNHEAWLTEFKIASQEREGFKELRTAVFHNTTQIIKQGGYSHKNQKINIENQENEHLLKNSYFYNNPVNVHHILATYPQKVLVMNADCLETANLLLQTGYNPIVLNMANGTVPGGAVKTGAGAQEENIFRRTNLYVSLYQYHINGEKYDIPVHPKYQYPLHKTTGGIYSPNITVFRGTEGSGYSLLKQPYKVAFVSVPAIHNPDVSQDRKKFYIVEPDLSVTKEKMRVIMRIAILNGHDALVLSAFGCGAFANPPHHIAILFKEIFEEVEFKNKLKMIVFAIIDDHNAWRKHNPDGNVLPFVREFC